MGRMYGGICHVGESCTTKHELHGLLEVFSSFAMALSIHRFESDIEPLADCLLGTEAW